MMDKLIFSGIVLVDLAAFTAIGFVLYAFGVSPVLYFGIPLVLSIIAFFIPYPKSSL